MLYMRKNGRENMKYINQTLSRYNIVHSYKVNKITRNLTHHKVTCLNGVKQIGNWITT